MNRTVFLFFILIIFSINLYARPSIDEAISMAAFDIADKCEANSILVIDDFTSPTSKMTIYIREQLADSIFSEDGLLQIVTREHMDKIEKELNFQNSGIVNEKTILSVAKRLGAQLLVFGKIEEYNNGYMLRVRILDIETGSYLFRKYYDIKHSEKTEQLLGSSSIKKKISVGLIAEGNKNSLDYVAPSVGFVFNFAPGKKIALGTKLCLSYDIGERNNQFYTLETIGLLRFYISSFSGKPASGFFLELQCGNSCLLVNSEVYSIFNFGGCTGYRITMGKFFLESELRVGHPYLVGAGINFGFQF